MYFQKDVFADDVIVFLLNLQSPHRTLDTAIPDLKSLGYDGIEIPLKSILHFGAEKFKTLIQVTILRPPFFFFGTEEVQNKLHRFSFEKM